jgi:hypothetical protein
MTAPSTPEMEPVDPQVEPASEPQLKTRKKQDRTTMNLLLIAGFVAVAGLGFAAGRLTDTTTATTGGPGAGGAGATMGAGGFGGRGGMPSFAPGQTFDLSQFGGGNRGGSYMSSGSLTGTVQSISATEMKVLLANGTTVTVALTSGTTYSSEASANPGDISVGSTVIVQIDTTALSSAVPQPGASASTQPIKAKGVVIAK